MRDMPIEKLLGELVVNVAEHFNLSGEDALAAVALSKLANELAEHGNVQNLTLEELSEQLYKEISMAE